MADILSHEFKIGDSVIIRNGDIFYRGTITDMDNSNYPYEVTMSDGSGSRNWFNASELTHI